MNSRMTAMIYGFLTVLMISIAVLVATGKLAIQNSSVVAAAVIVLLIAVVMDISKKEEDIVESSGEECFAV